MIYGFGKGELGSETSHIACVNCGQKDFVKFTVLGKYFHLIFIPVFPTGRKGQSVCANCRHALENAQFNPEYTKEYYRISGKFKTPKRHFGWLFLFAIITPFMLWHQSCNAKEDNGFITSPAIGDRYEIKLGWRSYTLYKVASFTKDSIYFYPSTLEVNKERMLDDDKMLKEENFDKEGIFGLSKKEIIDLRESEKIRDIVRD